MTDPRMSAPIAGLPDALAATPDVASVRLGTVIVGPDALAELSGVVSAVRGPRSGPVVVLTDAVPYARGDDPDIKATLVGSLAAERVTIGPSVAGDEARVHADEETVAEVLRRTRDADVLVSIGSGTLTDLGKVAAAQHDVPLVVVQSAASVNGFTDDQSVLLRDGAKRTTPSRYPDALVADTGIIGRAPLSLNAAGVGDLMSMFVAPADWLLASTLGMGPAYQQGLIDLVRPHGPRLLELAHGLEAGVAADVEDLTRLLALSGLTMGLAGCTAPSSGTEHVISHLLEMRLGEGAAWHGLQVGVATVVAVGLWQRVRRHLAQGGASFTLPDVDAVRGRVFEAFMPLDPSGRTARECWDGYARKLTWLTENPGRIESLLADWGRLDGALDPILMTPGGLADGLRGSAVPLRFTELGEGYDRATVEWAVAHGHLMRDRFTVADLADLLGIWDADDAAALLDDLAADGLAL